MVKSAQQSISHIIIRFVFKLNSNKHSELKLNCDEILCCKNFVGVGGKGSFWGITFSGDQIPFCRLKMNFCLKFRSLLSFRLSNRTLVDNGASLNATSLFNIRHNISLMEEHSVRCVINIENWTAWRLKDALSHNHCGYIHDDFKAPNVDPAYREVMVGHKQVRNI